MNTDIIRYLIKDINISVKEQIKIMEICGTHTQMIAKLGLKSLLSEKVQLISGPGCPVCVTDEDYIDTAIYLLRNYSITIATFGDLMRVRGSVESLLDMKSVGYPVLVIHSPLDMIQYAEQNKDITYVLLGVGFETTTPIVALTIKTAAERGITNLFFLTSLKRMKPILEYILHQKSNYINGFLCPGHVASIKGANYFKFISDAYYKPAVVCGFEALDIVSGIHFLVKQITNQESSFDNQYKRCVSNEGNLRAINFIHEVFDYSDGVWRGIGQIEQSALKINNKFDFLNAINKFPIEFKNNNRNQMNCQCKDILLGNKNPSECKLFSNFCNPKTPQGPCMVSTEGACRIAYRYLEGV